ncbi:uncharacterized protein [Rutidosis leptorrhynchoides]|uniref:uncharacterized protein n=1 Tax=Rutidosis leptorrhynchoides TaxID=125765 RepID=UPI003A99B802
MEWDFQNLKLVGTNLASYNRRFFELAVMCPNMVTPECRKITLGRAFNINSSEARDDPKLVTGTFLLDNHHVYVLFDYGADKSFVSREFFHNLKNPLSLLENLYSIELVNGNLMRADKVYRDCTLILAGTSFRIDVIPIKLRSFNLVVGMDWLADIVCHQKAIRIPVTEDEPLMVYGE